MIFDDVSPMLLLIHLQAVIILHSKFDYDVDVFTNCPDGKFHEWDFKKDTIICSLCQTKYNDLIKEKKDDENMDILVPPKEILEKFSSMTTSIFSTRYIKEKENQELESFRDFTLPLLINGQVTFGGC
jgi:hypothetical protein